MMLGARTAAWAKSGRVPWDYRLEYVASDFRQIFDTKLKPTLGMSAEMDIMFTATNNDDAFLTCKGVGNTRFSFCGFFKYQAQSEYNGYYYVLSIADGGSVQAIPSNSSSIYKKDAITLNERAVFKATTSQSLRELYKNGKLIGYGKKFISSNSPEVSLRMFGRIWNGTTLGAYCSARAYDVKIYDANNMTIRHYIPCVMNGVVGLWEECQEEFFHSETDTPLIGGPRVSDEL